MKLINGKEISQQIYSELTDRISKLKNLGFIPGLLLL